MAQNMPSLPAASEKSEVASAPEKSSAKPVEVIALRPGFIKQRRRAEGDRFTVGSMKEVANWMRCVDPLLEKKHQEAMKAVKEERKKKIEAAGK